MQDGASPYWILRGYSWLATTIPNRYMYGTCFPRDVKTNLFPSLSPMWFYSSGASSYLWISPASIPCDFFMWGFFKSLVYNSTVENVEDLNASTKDGFSLVAPVMCRDVMQRYRKKRFWIFTDHIWRFTNVEVLRRKSVYAEV